MLKLPLRKARDQREQGQVLVIFALFMVFVLIPATALAVDYGNWLKNRRDYQNLADAAVLAGIAQLAGKSSDPCPSGPTKPECARKAAWQSLKQQLNLALDPATLAAAGNTAAGSPYSEGGYRIWVDSPASAAGSKYPGAYGSSPKTLFTWVERDHASFFGTFFGQGSPTVSAWANGGMFSSRFAIVALCPKPGPCPQANSIKLAGTNTAVLVTNGDVGSNWGLQVTSNTTNGLMLPGDSQAYLIDYDKCASATWACPPNPQGGIQDPGPPTVSKTALPLRSPVSDPNYPLPSWIDDPIAVPNRTDFNADSTGDPVNPASASVSCAAGSTVLGPGSYDTIKVKKGCVILDPTFGLTTGQRPGIFRIRSELSIANGAFVIGDGVSLFFDSTVDAKKFTVGNDGGVVINFGNAGHAEQAKGAWTTSGLSPWTSTGPTPPPTYDTSVPGTGMAFYVRRPSSGTTFIFNMSGAAGIEFRGVLYGPKDAVGIGGNSAQSSAGQIIGWTIRYNGTSTLTQTFEGDADEHPALLEPTLYQ